MTAGNAGSDRHPAWYHNLVASPDVTVEAGTDTFPAVTTVAGPAERADRYERFAAVYPQAAGYQDQTARQTPVVILAPRTGNRPAA